ncbi:hypothetical protein FF1_025600 [Malus domestica]
MLERQNPGADLILSGTTAIERILNALHDGPKKHVAESNGDGSISVTGVSPIGQVSGSDSGPPLTQKAFSSSKRPLHKTPFSLKRDAVTISVYKNWVSRSHKEEKKYTYFSAGPTGSTNDVDI